MNNKFIKFHETDKENFFYNSFRDSFKLTNFVNDHNTLNHVVRVTSYLTANSKNYRDYVNLYKLLGNVQHYRIHNFVDELILDNEFNEIIDDKNSLFLKIDKSPSGSNNRILIALENEYSNFASRIYKEGMDLTNKTLVFLDDFVGTGTTAINAFNGKKADRKLLFCYIIHEDSISRLTESNIVVKHKDSARTIDNGIKEYFDEKNLPHLNRNDKYYLGTLISEGYKSPNNNTKYLYYQTEKWTNFLNVRSGNSEKLSILFKKKEDFKEKLYNTICEGKFKKYLMKLGYSEIDERRALFKRALRIGTNSKFETQTQNDPHVILIFKEIKKVFKMTTESRRINRT